MCGRTACRKARVWWCVWWWLAVGVWGDVCAAVTACDPQTDRPTAGRGGAPTPRPGGAAGRENLDRAMEYGCGPGRPAAQPASGRKAGLCGDRLRPPHAGQLQAAEAPAVVTPCPLGRTPPCGCELLQPIVNGWSAPTRVCGPRPSRVRSPLRLSASSRCGGHRGRSVRGAPDSTSAGWRRCSDRLARAGSGLPPFDTCTPSPSWHRQSQQKLRPPFQRQRVSQDKGQGSSAGS